MALQCFQFGAWFVNPAKQSLHDGKQERHLEPRAMDVLVALCRRPHVVISADELLEQCWATTLYGDNPVHKVIAQLRRELGDDPVIPIYIETIRKRGYRTLAEVRLLSGHSRLQSPFLHDSPFCGLLPFDEAHAAVFFGRNDAIFRLRELLYLQVQRPQPVEMVLLLGASGSGKTSLVRAGLLPALASAAGAPERPLHLRAHASVDLAEKGERSLLTILLSLLVQLHLLADVPGLQPGQDASKLAQQLIQNPAIVLMPCQASATDGGVETGASRDLLFIDRFEAIFDERNVQANDRNLFLRLLDTLARTRRVFVLLACRNDFYPHIAANPLLMECKLRGAHFDLAPPSQAEIAQMIRLPAQAANLRYEVNPQSNLGLDEILCESAVGNPDALPLLQYTLHELYRMKSPDGELGFAAYEQLGGMEGAIGQRAEQLVAQLSARQAECLPRIWSLVVRLSPQQPEIRSCHASWSALRDANEREVVQVLVESRLFVSELSGGVAGFGVAHEALLRRWPRLMAWIDSHRQSLQVRSRIAEKAQRWDSDGRHAELLLPNGRQLDEARALNQLETFALSGLEKAYIAASLSRSKWRQRLQMGTLASMVGLSALTLVLGMSAAADQKRANLQRVQGEALTGFMLGDFTDKLRPLGRLDLLDSVGAKALDYFSHSSDQDLNPAAMLQRAKALQVLAEVRLERHDSRAMLDALARSDKILHDIRQRMAPDYGMLQVMGNGARLRGQMAVEQSDFALANSHYRHCLALARQRLALDPGVRQSRIDEANAHTNLGVLAVHQRHYEDAQSAFLQAIRILQPLSGPERPDNLLKAELAENYAWAGYVKEMLGKLAEANHYQEKESTLVGELHRDNPSESLWDSRLALALQNQVPLNLALGNDDKALAISRQSEQILQQVLLRDPSNNARLLDMVMIQMRTLRILDRRGPSTANLLALQDLSKITQKMLRAQGTLEAWDRLDAQLQLRIGGALLKLGQESAARKAIVAAQARLESIFAGRQGNALSQLTVIEAALLRAELEQRSDNAMLAASHCRRGLALVEPVAKGSSDVRILDFWVRFNLCLHNDEAATLGRNRLAGIGYQDTLYLAHVAKHPLPNTLTAQQPHSGSAGTRQMHHAGR